MAYSFDPADLRVITDGVETVISLNERLAQEGMSIRTLVLENENGDTVGTIEYSGDLDGYAFTPKAR